MKDSFGERLLALWDKFKKSRRAQLLLAITFVIIVLGVYFYSRYKPAELKQEEKPESAATASYVEYLEDKLETTLSSVQGAGKVEVIVSLQSGFEYVYATEEVVKETTSGTLSTTSLVLVSGQPVIVKEIYPVVKGVVVVAPGAKDISVRMNLLEAIQTILEVSNASITILN